MSCAYFSPPRHILLAGVALFLSTSAVFAGVFPVNTNAEFRRARDEARASTFLSRATFGPTMADIQSLADRIEDIGYKPALNEWIDNQFALPPTFHRPLALTMVDEDGWSRTQKRIGIPRYRDHAWWHIAITADDQLRQRMAWALAQIFVVSDAGTAFNSPLADGTGQPRWAGLLHYYDRLVTHSFGNYRNALQAVTYHPIMGVYLSHVKNRKADPSVNRFPDENYAREVMQLFSIGTTRLRQNGTVITNGQGEPIETYDNEDIEGFARVFTGLSYGNTNSFSTGRRYSVNMKMFNSEHEPGPKELLGATIDNGVNGNADIRDALDHLFNQPNCAPFISRLLIQRFVKSNPSKGYISRVSRAFRGDVGEPRGDFKAVIRAILTDDEAIFSQRYIRLYDSSGALNRVNIVGKGTTYTRLREPVLRYTAMIRAFNPTSDYATGRFMMMSQPKNMNQAPYKSPSVFNFYLPNFSPQGELANFNAPSFIPDGELYAPEFQILTSLTANSLPNRMRNDVNDRKLDFRLHPGNGVIPVTDCDIALDFSVEEQLAATSVVSLMNHLDLLLCQGTMNNGVKNKFAVAVRDETTSAALRAEGAVLAVLTSPDCAVAE